MIEMIVFDMAGTTVDENNVVYKTVQKVVNDAGFDFSLEEVLEVAAGKEKLQAITSVLALRGVNNPELAKRIFEEFKITLTNAYHHQEITAQKNADILFTSLRERNILVVLNTGYSRPLAELILDKIGWVAGQHIDALVTASDVPKNRPEPDMILYAMKKFNLNDATQVIKVGDSVIDIEEGKNAGCLINIGITTGAHSREQLANAHPEYIIDDLLQILEIAETR